METEKRILQMLELLSARQEAQRPVKKRGMPVRKKRMPK
jgi:hypothetical protein